MQCRFRCRSLISFFLQKSRHNFFLLRFNQSIQAWGSDLCVCVYVCVYVDPTQCHSETIFSNIISCRFIHFHPIDWLQHRFYRKNIETKENFWVRLFRWFKLLQIVFHIVAPVAKEPWINQPLTMILFFGFHFFHLLRNQLNYEFKPNVAESVWQVNSE